MMIQALEAGKQLELLHRYLKLDLSVNELRIVVGCFRAVSYLMKMDDVPYLDADALELHKKLEQKYSGLLGESNNHSTS
jgi:hypothetical protein